MIDVVVVFITSQSQVIGGHMGALIDYYSTVVLHGVHGVLHGVHVLVHRVHVVLHRVHVVLHRVHVVLHRVHFEWQPLPAASLPVS